MVDCCVDLWAVIHGQPAVLLLIGIGTLQILYNWQIFVYILVHIMYCIYILYSLPNNSYLPYGDIPDVDRQTAGKANVTTRLYKSMVSSPFRANVQKCGLQVHIIGRVLLSFDRQSMAVIIEKRDMAHTRYMFFLHTFTFKYRLFAG